MAAHRSNSLTTEAISARSRPSGPWTVVEVRGEMDVQAEPLVRDVLSAEATCVVFDLRAVTFLDASGLRVLLDVRRRAVEVGGRVRLVAPSRPVRRILTLTRTDRLFLTVDTVEAAVTTPFAADLP
ncbi:MAG TPA: STAS domain-containing protein [Nocardioides sp.]|uniref:STAS domain-containing protein n=1 Tax=Nocardioides sp. TaxID=35761 RepID=UPI002C317A28|nr:STAS domain-containing protein [Nocardioides sp.]HTW18354.1 STAS domain-containing protein [Nocardioides sp.]